MFDIKAIRDNPTDFDRGLTRRGLAPLSAKLIAMDEARRACMTKLQEAQARRNAASKDIGVAKKNKDEASAAKLMAEVAELKIAMATLEGEERKLSAALDTELAQIPNAPRDDVPEGVDEHGNTEIRRVGTPATFSFKPKQHFEIGEALGLMDFEAAAKMSGARFVVLKGALARMERAIAQLMLNFHTEPENNGLSGYTEINPPLMVRDEAMFGTAQLPKFSEDQFMSIEISAIRQMQDSAKFIMEEWSILGETPQSTESDGLKKLNQLYRTLNKLNFDQGVISQAISRAIKKLHLSETALWDLEFDEPSKDRRWLIPTAEVPLTNLVRESILDEAKLPMRMTAFTPCFRAEAGAAGRDTRGMIRQHQFSKVELVSITTPEQSAAEHERMTACAEEILKRLGLPFRTMLLCTGDMGFASQKTYDLEVWLPGQDAYREISSCSVCGDFQARRMSARFRSKDGDIRHVHTLNGSGLAVGRTLVAILENYQREDGSVAIPAALHPYMGGLTEIKKA